MILTQTSVTQVTSADHDQEGGCMRRFWFERVHDLRPDQDNAKSDGTKGHGLLATYFSTGALPAKRVKMGKAVTAAILKGDLPEPGPDLIVEGRFDGGPMWNYPVDAAGQPLLDEDGEPRREYIPVNVAETFHLGGLPWDGAIDLTFRRSEVPSVWDWKFSSDIDTYAKRADQLIKTVQLPIYVLSQLPYWPDAKRWEIAHGYINRTGTHSFNRRAIVGIDQVLERGDQIAGLVQQMTVVATATDQDDVPFNRRSCHSWLGCPHQSICKAFKENKMNLSAEEQALFDEEPPAAPAPLQAADTKAARLARMKAELAALEAEPAAPRKRVPIVDVDAAGNPITPPAATQPAASIAAALCALCGVVLTPDNASKLSSGLWKHIGCAKESAPAATAPAAKPVEPVAPKARAPKPQPPAAPTVTVAEVAKQTITSLAEVAKTISDERAPDPKTASGQITLIGSVADIRALFAR